MALVLLPPSEGKTAATSGPTLDINSLAFPALCDTRRRVADALIATCQLPDDQALSILKVGSSVLNEVHQTANLFSSPCAPAAELYTGVLYDAAHLTPSDTALIFSGLFGITRASDLIPLYRLSMGVKLPSIGSVLSIWKKSLKSLTLQDLQAIVGSQDNVVFDARSSAYQVWTGQSPASNRNEGSSRTATHSTAATPEFPYNDSPFPFWTLRAVNSNGRVITHRAKYYRGLMTRALLDAGSMCNAQVPEVAKSLGFSRVTVREDSREITIVVD